jgi:hypothetical protein
MKRGRIFLIGKQENILIPMDETPYASEDILQILLASYPDLLPGDQITPENPRRWLLISREVAVPGDVDEIGRWSLDHLFIDQEGMPTFVECKRASDTRSRREVVAQMLDYAANGIEYWAIDRLRQAAAETARSRGISLDQEIQKLIGAQDEIEIEQFWQKVETNLHDGKVRLIFVADSTSKELRRLVEFLNKKLSDVEVLAVEVKQFLGGNDQKALVSRVIGLTEPKPGVKPRRQTNKDEFLAKCTPEAVPLFEHMINIATQRGYKITWGEVGFSVRIYFSLANRFVSFAYGYPPNEFQFYIEKSLPNNDKLQAFRKELAKRGLFREGGEQTLRLLLQGNVLSQFDEIFLLIVEKMEEVVVAA